MPLSTTFEYSDFTRLLAMAEFGSTVIDNDEENDDLAAELQPLRLCHLRGYSTSAMFKLMDHRLVTGRGQDRARRYGLTKRGRRLLAQLAALREAVGPVRVLILQTMSRSGSAAGLLHEYQALALHGLCKWVKQNRRFELAAAGRQLKFFAEAARQAEQERNESAPLPVAAQIGAVGLQTLYRIAEACSQFDALGFHARYEAELVRACDELSRLALCNFAGWEGPFLEFEITDRGRQVLKQLLPSLRTRH
jgi:hypothetical protein